MSAKKAKAVIEDEELNLQDFIYIKGARSNNLKNIDVTIPKHKLVVVTGLSGSGKSSLIMDTLYSEGQRRYVESLSSYARQFLNRIKKPDVDYIKGICPAIAVEQKVSTRNARSTVGSLTEIYDYFRLLYARVGVTISPVSGREVTRHSVSDVVDYIAEQKEDTRVYVLSPLHIKSYDRTVQKEIEILMQKGYTRLYFEGEILQMEDFSEKYKSFAKKKLSALTEDDEINILVSRVKVHKDDEEQLKALADSVTTAMDESGGHCTLLVDDRELVYFNSRFELDGIEFPEPTPQLFNYNNPFGACPQCEGFGRVMGIDEDKVIPDKSKSIYEGAVASWSGEKLQWWLDQFVINASEIVPVHRKYQDLTESQKDILWNGKGQIQGINQFFQELLEKSYKIQNRVLLARYRGKTMCPTCKGGRLRVEATYVKVGGKSLPELAVKPVDHLLEFFTSLELSEYDEYVGERILTEIVNRLSTMKKVGLGYLALERISSTLSGGETQRINLTRILGSNLTQSLYILDEPSVGLHPRDTDRLVKVLHDLRDLGNTVVVVEHEEEVIRKADELIDIGPLAGINGGELVYAGPVDKVLSGKNGKVKSLTIDYLTGAQRIALPESRRKVVNKLRLKGARMHNLKNIDLEIPLQAITAVTGVSGSGKTTLVRQILYPALRQAIGETYSENPGAHESLEGDIGIITTVEFVSQQPIGRSSRSNPITYVKAYDSIRKLLTDQQISKIRGYKPKHFSFNVDGGRCDTCKGEGEITVEMQFLADVKLTCEECKGQRFKPEVLEVKYKSKNISEILDLSIEEAMDFFSEEKDIIRKIKPLSDVGLGYIKLGQSSSTLSGGEAQRVKLASFLGKENTEERIFFIFDEPTTGLHFHDIHKLLQAFNSLVELGHTILVVEHNMEVIKSADWVIDLGPDGGEEGGHLVAQGTPEDVAKVKKSFTGQYLKEKLDALK